MIGMIYLPHRPFLPMVPHAMPWRCNLNANRDSARRLDWTWPICSEIFPFIGYIEPRQPAHQKSGSSGSFRVAAPQSAAQAVCALGLANNATSGLRRDRKSVVYGKSVSVSVDSGGGGNIKKKKK